MTQGEILQEIRKVQVWIYSGGDSSDAQAAPLQVLLLKTHIGRGSFWQPVTGGLDAGETFEQGALREAAEETGFRWKGEPNLITLGAFEYSKPGVPARFVESAFALKAPSLDAPELDPREHVEFLWADPATALGMLKFPSNADMLRRMLERLKSVRISLIAALLIAGSWLQGTAALAGQPARVIGSRVEIHEQPREESQVMSHVESGARVDVSSGTVVDADGERWHKVRVATGKYGFVRASEIKTQEYEQAIKDSRAEAPEDGEPERPVVEGYEWTFTARAMGLLGGGDGFQKGGEGELTFNPLFTQHGYLRRILGLGIAGQKFSNERVIAASFIYRFFQETRGEPELRVRVGQALDADKTVGGLQLGYRYPLTLARVRYLAAYVEAGALTSLSSGSSIKFFWGAAGLGFQF